MPEANNKTENETENETEIYECELTVDILNSTIALTVVYTIEDLNAEDPVVTITNIYETADDSGEDAPTWLIRVFRDSDRIEDIIFDDAKQYMNDPTVRTYTNTPDQPPADINTKQPEPQDLLAPEDLKNIKPHVKN